MLRLHYYKTFVFAALLALAGWRCEPIVTTFDDIEEAVYYRAASLVEPPPAVDTLLVMTWNIKFGGGDIDFWYDCWGKRVLMTEEEVLDNLEGVANEIRRVDPDILLLQEVDIEAKRVAYVDQMQYLLDHTYLNYGIYVSEWDVQFVASDGIGRVDGEGNAILSRWSFSEAKRIALPLRTDQDALTKYFYIRRAIATARLDIPGHDNFHVVTVHAAAFSQDGTKKKHIDLFKQELDRIDTEGGLFVAGGDLNTIPPGSQEVKDFPDSICEDSDFPGDDYSEETEWLKNEQDGLYDTYSSGIPLEDFVANSTPYFTFSSVPTKIFWNRKLDYLFTNHAWVPGSATTHQDIASGGTTLSDHCPVSVRIRLP